MPGSQPHSHLDDRVSRDSTPTRLKLALEMIYKWFRKAKRSPSQVPHQILAQGKWDHPGTPTGVAGDEKAEEAARAGQFFPICKLSLCCPHPMRRLWEGRGAGWERRHASCAAPTAQPPRPRHGWGSAAPVTHQTGLSHLPAGVAVRNREGVQAAGRGGNHSLFRSSMTEQVCWLRLSCESWCSLYVQKTKIFLHFPSASEICHGSKCSAAKSV